MAFTNTGIFFGFLVFWTVLISLTGIVSGSILLNANEGNISSALDSVSSEGGFFSVIFVWIANFLINTLGFEGIGTVYLGFASLPDWLNAMLFIPMVFMTVWVVVISLIPGAG